MKLRVCSHICLLHGRSQLHRFAVKPLFRSCFNRPVVRTWPRRFNKETIASQVPNLRCGCIFKSGSEIKKNAKRGKWVGKSKML